MARKRSRKQWREWLDCIAKVTCKTDDNFTCQIRKSPKCAGRMMPKDNNCQWCHIKSKESYKVRWLRENAITGCGQCHTWAHDNPDEFILWFSNNYPHRIKIINEANQQANRTWKQWDFERMEKTLLREAVRVNVDWINAPKTKDFPNRLKRKLEEVNNGHN